MKLLRVGQRGSEKPAIMDKDGKIRDISSLIKDLNPASIEKIEDCKIESGIHEANPGDVFQFERLGYFCLDLKLSKPNSLVFNRTVTLRDTWAKISTK